MCLNKMSHGRLVVMGKQEKKVVNGIVCYLTFRSDFHVNTLRLGNTPTMSLKLCYFLNVQLVM